MSKEMMTSNELKILLRQASAMEIVVGDKSYEVLPLSEGQLEEVSADIGKLFDEIFCLDRKCPKCGKVVKHAVDRRMTICEEDGEWLDDVGKSPMEAMLGSGKVPDWVHTITDISADVIKASMTLNQIRHFAGVFWKQNFDDSILPDESKENFTKLLGIIGMGQKKPEEKTEKPKTEMEKKDPETPAVEAKSPPQ